jgi:ribonuclease P protein component
LAVSRKVGKANVRNVVRRRLKEIFRLNRQQLQGSWDFVVVAQPHAAALDYEQLAEEFLGAARRAGALPALP